MKTITCDLCGETVESNWNKRWSSMVRTVEGIHRLSLQVNSVHEKELDICGACTASMMEWVEEEIATRPEPEPEPEPPTKRTWKYAALDGSEEEECDD